MEYNKNQQINSALHKNWWKMVTDTQNCWKKTPSGKIFEGNVNRLCIQSEHILNRSCWSTFNQKTWSVSFTRYLYRTLWYYDSLSRKIFKIWVFQPWHKQTINRLNTNYIQIPMLNCTYWSKWQPSEPYSFHLLFSTFWSLLVFSRCMSYKAF